MAEPVLAYLATGRLFLKRGDGPATPWVSPFAAQVQERRLSVQRRYAWKSQGRGARFATWGQPADEELPSAVEQVAFTALTGGRHAHEILYVLQTRDVSAILAIDTASPKPEELRLYHTADLRITGVAMDPRQERIAVCVAYPTGVTNLALLTRDGSHLTDVTEGDSIDAAPRWGADGVLVYQSAGLGRDGAGLLAGRTPFTICALDRARGETVELASSSRHDLLTPARDAAGALYYVRRPFLPPGSGPSAGQLARDLVLFPLRVVRAVLAWLDFFVTRYTGDSLRSAGGPPRAGPDEKSLFLLGNLVDVEKARRESLQAGDPTPALVPQSWELVRDHQGRAEVLARGVLAFHLADDGRIWYTNGNAVFTLDPSRGDAKAQRTARVCVHDRIEVVLPAGPGTGAPGG